MSQNIVKTKSAVLSPVVSWMAVAAVATIFALPAVAQDSSPDASTPASSPAGASTSTNAELGKYNTDQPLQTQSKEGFWGHLNPMARKKWVHRQVSPVQDRLNELDQLTTANAQQIRDLDERTQEGLQKANAAAQLADSHATQAGNTATQAQTLAQQSSAKTDQTYSTVNGLDQYQTATQVEIRFRNGQSILGKDAKAALDQLASQVQGQHGYLIDVQGYSSLRGQAGLNASRRMAEAITRYLVTQHTVPLYNVRQVGLGNAPITPQTQPQDQSQSPNPTKKAPTATMHYHGGIVEVSVMHNSLSALSASDMGSSPIGAAAQPDTAAQPALKQ
jgi:outer membrane protein OmpA-like peptidoglycan-associated protein